MFSEGWFKYLVNIGNHIFIGGTILVVNKKKKNHN